MSNPFPNQQPLKGHDMQHDQEPDFSSTLVIGEVEPVGGMEETGYAIFIDGDTSNFGQENVIDFGYFDNEYTYSDFLEDKMIMDQLCAIIDKQHYKLDQARNQLQQFHEQVSKLIEKLGS